MDHWYTVSIVAALVAAFAFYSLTRRRGRHAEPVDRARRQVIALTAATTALLALGGSKVTHTAPASFATPVAQPVAPDDGILTPRPVTPTPTPSPARTSRTFTRKVVPIRDRIIAQCRVWLGVPYVWGGTTPRGFDCSGYTQAVYRKVGITIPRVAHDQMRAGNLRPTTSPRPGDLVFFLSNARIAYHCGLYIREGWMYAAPKRGDHVREQAISAPRVVYRTAF